MSLRERKAAQTRAAIIASLHKRLATTPLADITVDEIAADANISRVTFHNYFPTKEQAVDFLFVCWKLEVTANVVAKKLRGVRAILELFEMTGRQVAESPITTLRLYGHLATRTFGRPMPEPTAADRELLVPGVDTSGINLESAGRMIMELVEQARREDGLELEGTTYELAQFLGALLNGAATTGQSSPDTDWVALFRRHARRALGIGFDSKFDDKPVAAPKTPLRYRKGGKS